ncbi:DNA dC-_dU-editing enzyme APOBEC-3C-like isoform X2 [Artibeus jamaicensis]|uniref:DNA dC->dU-editing enzyme APOBEC-3C-like isoform X2 n=1 Tax=Artibeus jamaicensis TaxID=9417 RepID=UPI00235A95F5|nr:DNA dC->dU-editing enzyme APOBEC-3C-like isoform X2 [Artibeus jamaicensis]
MEPWPSSPMHSLPPKIYNTNFRNLLFAPGLNNTYICFEVAKWKNNSLKPCYWGVFRNQPSHLVNGYLEEPLHAEQLFLSWFDDQYLSRRVNYHVTWFMSWSPCLECAEEVVHFLGEHENVSLNISASRLYKCEDEDQQQGLQLLDQEGVEVAVMSPEDFEYCWDNFVDHRETYFRYWKGIRRNYYALRNMLEEILWG